MRQYDGNARLTLPRWPRPLIALDPLKLQPLLAKRQPSHGFVRRRHSEIPRSEDKYIVSSFVAFVIPAADQVEGYAAHRSA
jgi:hypothetical protein